MNSKMVEQAFWLSSYNHDGIIAYLNKQHKLGLPKSANYERAARAIMDRDNAPGQQVAIVAQLLWETADDRKAALLALGRGMSAVRDVLARTYFDCDYRRLKRSDKGMVDDQVSVLFRADGQLTDVGEAIRERYLADTAGKPDAGAAPGATAAASPSQPVPLTATAATPEPKAAGTPGKGAKVETAAVTALEPRTAPVPRTDTLRAHRNRDALEMGLDIVRDLMTMSARGMRDLNRKWGKAIDLMQDFDESLLDAVQGMIREIDPDEFETRFLRFVLCALGYRDISLTPHFKDGGADAYCKDAKGRLVVAEAKRYNGCVDATKVRALLGVASDKAAAKAVYVTSGRFGREVVANYGDKMELVDGHKLACLLLRERAVPGFTARTQEVYAAESE